MHIKSIYEDKELEAEATLKNFLTVRQEGSRQVNRNLEYYNLDIDHRGRLSGQQQAGNGVPAMVNCGAAGLRHPGLCDRPQTDGERS